ncbi:hypothetical protein EDM29_14410, partial [Staphylococcus aureus]
CRSKEHRNAKSTSLYFCGNNQRKYCHV